MFKRISAAFYLEILIENLLYCSISSDTCDILFIFEWIGVFLKIAKKLNVFGKKLIWANFFDQ